MMQAQGLRTPWLTDKAGMAHVDKQRVRSVIAEMTAGSPKHLRQLELEKLRNLEIQNLNKTIARFATYPEEDRLAMAVNARTRLQYFEKTRDLSRFWAHFDYDMFYVACQLLDKPELRDKPVCVSGSGSGSRGVVSTSNYIARTFGVRSAMPCFIADRLCPQLVHLPCDFKKYKHYSKIFRDILRQYDPDLESMGLDQAYVDLTDHIRNCSLTPEQHPALLESIRARIYQATGLTVSCGMGANRQLCKMCSQVNKPNGQFVLPNERSAILQFVGATEVRKLPGIGPVNEKYLRGININKAADLVQRLTHVRLLFTDKTFDHFLSLALGISRNYHQFTEQKSLSRQLSFLKTKQTDILLQYLDQVSSSLANDLQQHEVKAGSLTLTFETSDFVRKDRSAKLDRCLEEAKDILTVALQLFQQHCKGLELRLLGVKCSRLVKPQQQHTIMQVFSGIQPTREGLLPTKVQCPVCSLEVKTKGNYAHFEKHFAACAASVEHPTRLSQPLPAPERSQTQQVRQSLPPKTGGQMRRGKKKSAAGQSVLQNFIK